MPDSPRVPRWASGNARAGAPLQLARNLIRVWIRKYEAGEFTDEVAGAVRTAEYEQKIAELERKVGQLTMEVDLLKKGARLARAGNDASCSIVSGPGPSPSRKEAES